MSRLWWRRLLATVLLIVVWLAVEVVEAAATVIRKISAG